MRITRRICDRRITSIRLSTFEAMSEPGNRSGAAFWPLMFVRSSFYEDDAAGAATPAIV